MIGPPAHRKAPDFGSGADSRLYAELWSMSDVEIQASQKIHFAI